MNGSAGRPRALEALLLTVAIAAAGAGVYYANGHLTRRMQELKQNAVALLEQRIEHRVSYRSISPSILGYLEVRDLTVFSLQDPQPPLLKVSRVKIHYSIVRLLLTREPLQALTEIQIANSAFRIEEARDRELLELLRRLPQSGSAGALPRLRLSGSNITLSYQAADWQAQLSELFFSIEDAGEYFRVVVRGAGRYEHGGPGASPQSLAARVTLNGKVDRGLAWSDLGVRVDSLVTEAVRFRRQTLQVSYADRVLKVNKIQDRAPLDLQLSYDFRSSELGARFNLVRLTPSSLMEFTGPLRRYNDWLGSSLTAAGFFSWNLARGTMSYQADAEALPADTLVPLDLYLVSRLRGNEKVLYLEPLVVHSPQGTLEFYGDLLLDSYLPAGLLRLTSLRAGTGPALTASLELQRTQRSLAAYASRLQVGEVTLAGLSLSVVPGDGESQFQLSASLPGAEAGSISAFGAFNLERQPSLRMEAGLRKLPLASLSRLAGSDRAAALGSQLEPFVCSLDLSLATDFRSYSLTARDVQVVQREDPRNWLRFALELSQDGADLRDLRASWQGYSLSGQAQALFSPARTDLKGLLVFENTPYQVAGSFLANGELRLEGGYGLSVVVSPRVQSVLDQLPAELNALRGTGFSVQVARLPLPLKRGTLLLSTEVQGILTPDGGLYAQSPRTTVANYPFLAVKENTLELAFTLQQQSLNLTTVRYRDRYSTVTGQGAGTVSFAAPLAATGWVRLQDGAGRETYSLTGGYRGGVLEARLEFNRTPLERAGELPVSGDLSGALALQGTLLSPRLTASLRLEDGKLNADSFKFEATAGYNGRRLSLEGLNVSLLTHRLSGGRGSFDLESGELDFSSGYEFDFFGKMVHLDLQLQGSSAGGGGLEGVLDRDVDATLRLAGIRVKQQPYPEWLLRLRARGGVLSLAGGPQESIRGSMSRTGEFALLLKPPLPVQGSIAGQLRGDRIDSEFRASSVDMRIINTLLAQSTDIIQFTAGTGSGVVRIAGLLTDPDWFGSVDVRDARARFQLSPDEITPINGRLEFNEKTFSFPRLSSYCGRARVEAEGLFTLDHWVPRSFQVDVFVQQYPGVHIKSTFPPIALDGYGTGAVRVQGEGMDTSVEGRITANQCRIALVRVEAEPPVQTAPLWLDLDITVGRGVEFFWPSLAFPVVHTNAKQGEQVLVNLNGASGLLTLAGDVEIRGGEIFYFDRSFYLRRGSIRFDEGLGEVDPWISALAEIRERDQNNEEIKIYLEADNRLSMFSPRFYSDPVRLDMEIMQLIGGNIVDRFADSSFGLSAVMLTSDIIGQFGLLTPFERAVRRLLNLDMFSIRSQFLQNVLLGRLVGGEQGLANFNPLDNTTVSLGKYVGTDLFVQALVRFQATDAASSAYSIQPEGEVNLEWVTPFFLLEWSFAPKHPEDLFVSDNSLGLSWKFSY